MAILAMAPAAPLLRVAPLNIGRAWRRRTLALLVAVAVAVAITIFAEVMQTVNRAELALDRASAYSEGAPYTQLSAEGLSAAVGSTHVQLPLHAGGEITLDSDMGVLRVGLPVSDPTISASRRGSSTLLYDDPGRGVAVAAQALQDGARALVVLNSPTSPKSFTFRMSLPEGVTATDDGDGGFDLVRAGGPQGSIGVVIGTISAPWAKDAVGRSVSTSYSIKGSDLVQTIRPASGTEYPIVADPHYTWGYVTGTAYYNRQETRTMKTSSTTLAIVGGLCAAFGPETLGAGCAAGAAEQAQWAYVAQNAYDDGKCVKIRVPIMWAYAYSGGYCK